VKAEPLLTLGRIKIHLLEGYETGDITNCGADVLVSSAGTSGEMGGYKTVAQTIREKGGDEIRKDLNRHMPLIPGDVVITSAGKLPAKNIYHAVVVSWKDEQRVLQATIWRVVSRCMDLAQLTNMTSIAFPSLGTGSGGADRFETYSTMAAACLGSLRQGSSLRDIYFCFTYEPSGETFRTAFLQQQLIRQAHGLTIDDQTGHASEMHPWEKFWAATSGIHANVDKLVELVTKLEQYPGATVIVNTDGGAYIVGDVKTNGGDFVSRDKTIQG
jgi:O-acetyl-ADP-ribose deacetylase (regulator of RNase III)